MPVEHAERARLPAAAKLVIQVPGQRMVREVPLDGPVFTIGRAHHNDIAINYPYVSRDHARLEQAGSSYRLVDVGSTNGLLLNGVVVRTHLLRHNDIIRIPDEFGNSVSLTYVDPRPPPRGYVTDVSLTQQTVALGRDPSATVSLDSLTISRHHARIDFDGATHTITDLASITGTFVNGQRIHRHQLRRGDAVNIGLFRLEYTGRSMVVFKVIDSARLDAQNVSAIAVQNGQQKALLHELSLSIAPGEFVAVVGSSGAGKSTLLAALSALRRVAGRVLFNGTDVNQRLDVYRSLLGYVPQDDAVHLGLPVANALRYAAALRLPPDASIAEIDERVRKVLARVGLTRNADQMVHSLSGGERKRVSIAAELLAEPVLFFLDEPTSGLDPAWEKNTMYRMRLLADGGQTVILVTHATENIVGQCDRIAFMARGRLVFFGSPAEALQFFEANDSLADIYSKLDPSTQLDASQTVAASDPEEAERRAHHWETRFKQSQYYHEYVTKRAESAPAASAIPGVGRGKLSPVRQWWILSRRNMELIRRDKTTLRVLLAVMPLIGLLVAAVSGRRDLVGLGEAEALAQQNYNPIWDAQGILFLFALAAVSLGIFAGAKEIVREQPIYRRERMAGLGIVPYVLSKVGVLAVFGLAQAASLLIAASAGAGLGLGLELPGARLLVPAPVELYVTLVLANFGGVMLGLLISAIAGSEARMIYLVMFALFVQIIFAGGIFPLPGAAKPIAWLTLTYWALNALGSTANMPALGQQVRVLGQSIPYTDFRIPYTFTASHVIGTWTALILLSLVLGATVCVYLRLRDVGR